MQEFDELLGRWNKYKRWALESKYNPLFFLHISSDKFHFLLILLISFR